MLRWVLLPSLTDITPARMHLMYNEDPETGKRIYVRMPDFTRQTQSTANTSRWQTLKKVLDGTVTKSAHPARFSPDDKYSRYAPFGELVNNARDTTH